MSQIEDIDVLDFKGAIADSKAFGTRHLLLGNGFSIACDPRFNYRTLLGQANFSEAQKLPEVFSKMGTKDFEQVIRILRDTSKVLKIYDKANPKANPHVAEMEKNAKMIKNILISTITKTHLRGPQAIDSGRSIDACQEFLKHFLKEGDNEYGGEIYTLNYDFLLYWACMHKSEYLGEDGFGRKGGNGHLIWKNRDSQTVHYLHGALHFFHEGSDLCKHEWNDGHPLRDKVLKEISLKKLPLFVAEGTSKQKWNKIKKNEYLLHCYNSFLQKMNQPNDTLFIFGHSLKDKDKHILDCITEGKIPRVYVDLRGKTTLKRNVDRITFARRLKDRRHSHRNGCPLEVKFFDSKSAKVWG